MFGYNRPSKKQAGAKPEAIGMEFCFSLTPRLPDSASDNTYRKCHIVLENQQMMADAYPGRAVWFNHEKDRTLMNAGLATKAVGLEMDDPLFKETHHRYTERVMDCFGALKDRTCKFLRSGVMVNFHVSDSVVWLDQWWDGGEIDSNELSSLKEMLARQQAACQNYKQNFDKGTMLVRKNKPKKAIEYFDAALLSLPDDPKKLDQVGASAGSRITYNFSWAKLTLVALSGQGGAYAMVGKHEKSMECFERAIKLNPNSSTVLTNKGRALSMMKCSKEAIECFEQAISIRPDHDTALLNIGVILLHSDDRKGAIKYMGKVLAVNPDYRKAAYYKMIIQRNDFSAKPKDLAKYLREQREFPDIKCHMCKKAYRHESVKFKPYFMEKDEVESQLTGYAKEIVPPGQAYQRLAWCNVWDRIMPECLGACPSCSEPIQVFWFNTGLPGEDKSGLTGIRGSPTGSFFVDDPILGEPDYKKPQDKMLKEAWQCSKCGRQTHYTLTTLYSSVRQGRKVLAMLCKCGHETRYPGEYNLHTGVIKYPGSS